ncbi:SDR family NAD(P)-dependent oxidoreductase [Ferrimonas lipolytica]|uniref:SDR family NAD(P)-dependent oxidoreductase n=1 Tax=Ferrimonas lipolytica TaxID=2724191 RepID=A0A6H1UBU2_9GAMM|nr:SDR family NAD(P)-dependent oxidoreductase [Ferrimonas lipolytica]QIZ75676.1 SDR family NAD(P)-dependent oxidoreductase [Ferrimonas lipolytica]
MPSVLITGASSGIGARLAQDYAADGWRVTACGRNAAHLAHLQQFGDVQPCIFDVTELVQCQQALRAVAAPDLVILNAGTCEYIDCECWNSDDFNLVINSNISSINHCLSELLPILKEGAVIAIVDSLARLLPFTRSHAYGASKAAVHFLAKTLAVDLASRQIRVVSISPGFVRTPLTQRNDFAMPGLIEVDDASERIRAGIAAGKRSVAFPKRLYWPLKVLSWLPDGWQIACCQRMIKIQ